MQNIDKLKKRGVRFLFYLILLIAIGLVLSLYMIYKWDQSIISSQKTEAVEDLLTKEHGSEAREAVSFFEENWFSLKMHKDPETYLNELLIGPLLLSYRKQINFYDEDVWLVPGQTDVLNLRILDYDDRKMRLIACLKKSTNKVDRTGTVLEQYPLHQEVKFYLFIREGEIWKLGNSLDITDPKQALQDWDYMSQDLKDITGEINSFVYRNCETE